jgi:hypothetical protein
MSAPERARTDAESVSGKDMLGVAQGSEWPWCISPARSYGHIIKLPTWLRPIRAATSGVQPTLFVLARLHGKHWAGGIQQDALGV